MNAVTYSQERLLTLIGDTIGLLELEEFRDGLLDALRGAVPAEWAAISDVGPDAESIVEIIDPAFPAAQEEAFRRLYRQNPLVEHFARTRDGRPLRFSDVITRRQLHALELYAEVYRPVGIEYQIAFTLPHEAGRILGVVLCRGQSDFSDAERDLLEAARPFLIQAYRNAIHYSELLIVRRSRPRSEPAPELSALVDLGLTRRQAQILQLLCVGAADRDIATHLGISPRTVQKHLERCYRLLGVSQRADATQLAWATAEGEAARKHVHRPKR
ncbi:MAG TPA: helix-turn-helix transcriptional regulator [Solirubrobacteraceae bacterium]|nr:helix-turn-helix transcriptional regulator [Solirubrobacteraceae bacterium]